MRIYLATWLQEPNQGVSLTNKNAKTRLVSYYLFTELKQQKTYFKKMFKKYVFTGKVKSKNNKK